MRSGMFWKRILWWLGGTILMALIQTSWPESLKLQDTAPDLVLVLVVYVRADVITPALVGLALLTAGEVAIGRGLRHRGGTHSS